jgi:hypothetical protein
MMGLLYCSGPLASVIVALWLTVVASVRSPADESISPAATKQKLSAS